MASFYTGIRIVLNTACLRAHFDRERSALSGYLTNLMRKNPSLCAVDKTSALISSCLQTNTRMFMCVCFRADGSTNSKDKSYHRSGVYHHRPVYKLDRCQMPRGARRNKICRKWPTSVLYRYCTCIVSNE